MWLHGELLSLAHRHAKPPREGAWDPDTTALGHGAGFALLERRRTGSLTVGVVRTTLEAMNTPTFLRGDPLPQVNGMTGLAGARVVSVEVGQPTVELADGRHVLAKMALAFPYRPLPGDELLVIGREERHFVIGVLNGQGQTTLEFPADLELRAEGSLALEANEEIALSSERLDVEVGTMRVVADTVVHSARELYQRVRDLWSVRAGKKEEQVTGEWSLRSEKASITTSGDVSVNGQEIRLG